MQSNEKITPSNIRYLLTMKAFADAGRPIRITYLAEYLHYKKSSIHAMIQHLSAAGLASRNADNTIVLTEKGAATAVRYQSYYKTIEIMIRRCFGEFDGRENAVFALLAEIPEQALQSFQEKG